MGDGGGDPNENFAHCAREASTGAQLKFDSSLCQYSNS